MQTEQQLKLINKKNSNIRNIQLKQSIPDVPLIPNIFSKNMFAKENEQILQEQFLRPIPYRQYYNWKNIMQFMVDKILQIKDIIYGSKLLVDNINDRTNIILNINEANKVLYNMLTNSNKFTLISTQQLIISKKHFGLELQDSLSSRSKTIGIARDVSAIYVLCSSINRDNMNIPPILHMQLILVQTGEIIWSDKIILQI